MFIYEEPTSHEKAVARLVLPVNLLTAEGLITATSGLCMFIIGMWQPVINGAPLNIEDIVMMFLGLMFFTWGSLVCYAAHRMQDLSSYRWAVVGAVMGIFPLLVGIYALVVLMNSKVKAGFREGAAGVNAEQFD